MFDKIVGAAQAAFSTSKMVLKDKAPTLMVVGGAVGAVTATVMACVATTHFEEIVDDLNEDLDKMKKVSEAAAENEDITYTEEQKKSDMVKVYVRAGAKFVKLYLPAALVLAASIFLIGKSHVIMQGRHMQALALYEATDHAFKMYRDRVKAAVGEEMERDIRYAPKQVDTEKVPVIDETGAETGETTDEPVYDIDLQDISPYAKFFDDGSRFFDHNSTDYNLNFLLQQQSKANDMLDKRGYLFLNEVYQMLGIPVTQIGQSVGWLKCGKGDGFVDFGIYDMHSQERRRFVNGVERYILLDFNVDGDITKVFAKH